MSSEFLIQLDAFGLAAAGWIATWMVHGLLLCSLALLVGRFLRTGLFREQLYKVALIGAFVTTGAQLAGVGVGDALQLEFARSELVASGGDGRAIGIVGGPSGAALPAVAAPTSATPALQATPVASFAPTAHWRWAHALPLAALLAALIGGASLLRDRRRLRRVLVGRRPVQDPDWNAELSQLCTRAGLARAPQLSSSARLGSPLALAHGELVIPARALAELDPPARRALLAHELAHLARRDPQWLIATAVIARVCALQPLQLLVRRRLTLELELACDARAVSWTGDGLPLARCLATVASWIAPEPAPVLAASMAARGSALVQRVEHALAPACPPRSFAQRRVFCLSIATALALFACSGPRIEAVPPDPDAQARGDRLDAMEKDAVATERASQAEASLGAGISEAVSGAPAQLDFLNDGTIRDNGVVLYDPAIGSFDTLAEHLEGLAAGMETEPLDPPAPNGFRIAMGELLLHGEDGAPFRNLQKAMEECGRIGIWRLTFTGDWPGGEVGIPVPLPTDIHELEVPVEEEELEASIADDPSELPQPRAEVALRVLTEGRKLDPISGEAWSGKGRYIYDDSRVIEYQVGPAKMNSLKQLANLLGVLTSQGALLEFTIDARKGTVYRDVVEVLDIALAAGYEQVTFVGSYE